MKNFFLKFFFFSTLMVPAEKHYILLKKLLIYGSFKPSNIKLLKPVSFFFDLFLKVLKFFHIF
jgi:hypothetical protein